MSIKSFLLYEFFLIFFSIATQAQISLGDSAQYNAIIFGDFRAQSSDVEGRLAVQGDVNLNHYSVGDKLPDDQLNSTLISGGNISYPSGRVYYGHILAAGSVEGIGAPVINGLQPGAVVQGNTVLPIDFSLAYEQLTTLSQSLMQIPVNTTFEHKWGGLYLHGNCSSDVQVFSLEGSQVLDAHTFQVDCIPANAHVVINISGQSAGLTNMSMDSLATHRERVIYNFHEAETLTLSGIGVEGTVLAPYADVVNPQGVIRGQLVAKSWDGMMQINHMPFSGQPSPGQTDSTNTVIWAQNGSDSKAIEWSGSNSIITGDVHSNSGIDVGGSDNEVNGSISWVTQFEGGDDNNYSSTPQQTNHQPWPHAFDLTNYQPGGSAALAAGADYHNKTQTCNQNDKWEADVQGTQLESGLYWIPCDVVLNASDLTGHVSIVSTGKIEVSGSDQSELNAYQDGILFWTTYDDDDAIKISGSTSSFNGLMLAQHGTIELSGSNLNLNCGLAADRIKLNGSNLSINASDCDQVSENLAPEADGQVITLEQSEPINITLTATDGNGDDLSFQITADPVFGELSGTAPDVTYTPIDGFVGIDVFNFTANDGELESNAAEVAIRVRESTCELYPYIIKDESLINVGLGDEVENYKTSVTNSHHSLLTWTGENHANALAASFTMPGNSHLYTNPDDVNDQVISIGDWVQGVPGKKNASQVRAALDDLIGQSITVPLWSETRETGSRFDYHVSGFARIELTSYQLNGKPKISFIYQGQESCNNFAPFTLPGELRIERNTTIDMALTVIDEVIDGIHHLKTVHDADQDTLSYTIVKQPLNGTLTGEGPEYTYTPNTGFSGTDSFEFQVNDGTADSNVSTITIQVHGGNQAPVANDDHLQINEDQAISITLTGDDADGDTLDFQIQTQPTSGTLTGTAPNLSYTPNTDFFGIDTLAFTTTDGIDVSNTATITIEVLAVNDAPVAVSQNLTVNEDQILPINLTGSDVDGDVLNYQIISNTIQGSITGSGSSWSYRPENNFYGSDQFTFVANDGSIDSAPATIFIEVLSINDAPSADHLNVQTDQGQALSITLTGADPDGDALSYVLDSQPFNGSLSGSANQYTYTPNPSFSGTDTFTYHVNDGQIDSNTATVNIVINAVNQAPTADDLNITTDEDTAVAIMLTGSDSEGDALNFNVLTQPVNGVLSGTAPDLTYTPNVNFNGSDSFTYSVNDGALDSNVATINITINSVNDAPVAQSAAYSTSENLSIDLILEAMYPEGDEVSYQIVSSPINGRLTGSGKEYTYTPNSFFEGSDSFEFWVYDGSHYSNVATIAIEVIGHGNNPPVITSEPNMVLSLTNKPVGDPELIDLSSWEVNDFQYRTGSSQGPGDWQFNSDFTQVTQVNNARPGALISDFNFTNQKMNGVFSVETHGDDDFIGFVFGFHNKYQHYVFVWKRSTQGNHIKGMGLWKVDLASDGSEGEPELRDSPYEKAIHLFQNDIGWQPFTDYAFTLVQQNGEIAITVTDIENNILIDSFSVYDDRFPEGRFGFYNNSQPWVTYSGFKRDTLAEEIYHYNVEAIDPDGDSLTYELINSPAGMSIDPLTGMISWQTNTSSLGVVSVSVLVTDEHGATDIQNYQLIVSNDTPVIVSEPITLAYRDFNYAYQVESFDPNPSDVISYRLLEGPTGMSIQEFSGLLTWSPEHADIGTHNIIIEAVDLADNTAVQSYQLVVSDAPQNSAPEFQSLPNLTATVGRLYTYTPVATDVDGDEVTIALIKIPYDMQMIDGQTITWIPTSEQVTSHEIELVAIDYLGAETRQTFNISVSDVSNNQAPSIHSTPAETNILTNTSYGYQVIASDPENDVLTYSLHTAPNGMGINQSNGLINWLPSSDQFGNHPVSIQVTDTNGAYIRQNFDLTVYKRLGNNPPEISSVASNVVNENQLYVYELVAADPDGDEISYSLIASPSEMSIDEQTGRVEWQTTPNDVGLHEVVIEVSDSLGLYVRQSFGILVRTAQVNRAPEILSAPVFSTFIDENYQYQIQAIDVDGDALVYQLSSSPVDMMVNQDGLIEWTPDITVIGDHEIAITVSDQRGGVSTQTYTLSVLDPNIPASNKAPVITSIPLMNAMLGTPYHYQVIANDADNDTLNYQLLNLVNGASMDANSGLLTWEPNLLGTQTIEVGVFDGQVTAIQSWTVTVNEVTPLSVEVIQTPIYPIAGDDVTVTIIPVGAVGSVSLEVDIEGEDLPLNQLNQGLIENITAGQHQLTIHINDDVNTETIQHTLIVHDESISGFEPPIVDILTPGDGAIITGFNDIQVRVQDDNLDTWRLSYRYAEDDYTQRVTLAEGTENIDDAIVAEWDTSLLRNGIYVLLIEGTDQNGQRSSIAHSVFLEGDLKLGHFSIAFEDMSIPVAGIPITITRGYDTRDRNRDRAFGKGWSIGFESVRVQESRIPGLAWYMETGFFSIGPAKLPRYCIRPAGEPLVSVVMPDGDVEKFKVKAKTHNPSSDVLSDCQDITPPQYVSIEFEPQGDTNSTLVSNEQTTNLNIINGNLEELAVNEPVNPNLYTLMMLDGTEYSLDQGFNVREIKTTTGHTLTFTEDGIEHSGGLSVSFIRDAMGRITRIEKENGEGVDYTYDTNGDLVSFTDLNQNTTTFTYINDHYLEDIIDPRGIRVARNEYDADGRLVAHIDADGNRIEYDNDLVNMTSTITDRRGNPTINAFDNAGNIITQTNALGESTHYEYNHLRLETARTNHLGHRTEWTYDSQGNQLTEKDPMGHVTTSTYNRKGELLTQSVDELALPTITNVYNPDYDPMRPSDPQHGYAQLSTVTDALGRMTQFHWQSGVNPDTGESTSVNTGYTDADGNTYDIMPINGGTNSGLSGATTDLNGLRTETTYDDEARPLTEKQIITDENGDAVAEYNTSYEYNANGDVIKVTDHYGNETHTEYNALNKVSATIDALGRRTEMEYDDRGNQALTRYPDGSTETMVYDEENNVIETTDRKGSTTKMVYDKLNRVIAVIHPDDTPNEDSDNPMTVNDYDQVGRLKAVSDARGNTTRYEYDRAGRRTKTIDPLFNETRSEYDALGRRIQSIDALLRETHFQYNDVGSIERTDFENGTFTTVEYDRLGRKVLETDLAGLPTRYEYDAAGNLTAVIDALLQRTEFSYDQRGNKQSQTDAAGKTTRWTYDALNRVTSRILPMDVNGSHTEHYTYDKVGNRISKTDFNGDVTSYEYNLLNQLVKTTYQDGTTVINTYTITGQMETVTETNGTTSYAYDAQDRLTRIDYPTGQYIEYQYDLNGNRTQVRTANQTVDYTHDKLNRVKTVTDAAGTTTYHYDMVGNRASQEHANGTTATYSYDQLNRLTELTHTDASDTVIASYAYELGANGNRLSLTEGTGRVVEYEYDQLYRLLSETVTDPINGNHFSQWTYDQVGNRTQQEIDGVITTYVYNDNDHLLSETEAGITTTYTYDDNGNTLEKAVDGLIEASYSYSKDNRMLSANTNGSNITYTYDAGGIRQSQTVDGNTTYYLVDPNRSYHQVLEEQNDLFLPQVTYTYGDDLLSQNRQGDITTYGYDGLGSTRILTDQTGTVKNSYGYQAFGDLDYQHGSVENSYLFTGEQYDNNVGFYYLRARYYDPSIGRFQNMDTFSGMQFEPLSLHKYLYAHADPVNNIDPSGNVALVSRVMGNLRAIVAKWARPISPRKYIKKAYTYTKRTYAQTKRLVKQCIQQPKKCKLGGAVLVTGGADSPITSEHISDAQMGRGSNIQMRPAPFMLNYQKKKQSRSHLRPYTKAGGVCEGNSRVMYCDEYPFYSTRQGAPRNLPGHVSLRLAPAAEQAIQSQLLSALVRSCRLKQRPIKKSRYVSIALPSANIPSAVLCLNWR